MPTPGLRAIVSLSRGGDTIVEGVVLHLHVNIQGLAVNSQERHPLNLGAHLWTLRTAFISKGPAVVLNVC